MVPKLVKKLRRSGAEFRYVVNKPVRSWSLHFSFFETLLHLNRALFTQRNHFQLHDDHFLHLNPDSFDSIPPENFLCLSLIFFDDVFVS